MAYFICNLMMRIALKNARLKKEITDETLRQIEEGFKPEQAIVQEAILAATIWNLRKSGQWEESQFCLAMEELATASDKYLKMELEKR